MLFSDVKRAGKPESAASNCPDGVGTTEVPLEDMRKVGRGDPDAAIADLQHCDAPLFARNMDDHVRTVGAVLRGIHQEVRE